MTSGLATIPNNTPVVYQAHGESGEVSLSVDDIRNFLCPTATLEEATMFLKVCQYQGLNPFIGDAYLVVYEGQHGRNVSIITGKDTFTKRAHRNPEFEGFQAGIVVLSAEGEIIEREGTLIAPKESLLGGWANVFRKDCRVPFKQVATLKEFDNGRRNWASMKGTMIRKVALVQALREAFPEDLGTLYDSAEIGSVHLPDNGPPEYVQEKELPAPELNAEGRQAAPIVDQQRPPVVESSTSSPSEAVDLVAAADLLYSGKRVGPQITRRLKAIITKDEWDSFKSWVTDAGVPGDEIARVIAEDKRFKDMPLLESGTPKQSVMERGYLVLLDEALADLYKEAASDTSSDPSDVMAPEKPPEVVNAPESEPEGVKDDSGDNPPENPPAPPAVDEAEQPASVPTTPEEINEQLPF